MSPKSLTKLKAAASYVDAEHRKGTAPEAVIQVLVDYHGAKLTPGDPNRLRCCGVVSSCTYSRGAALLAGWRRLAGCALQVGARK